MAKPKIYPALLDATEAGLEQKIQLVRTWRTPIHLDLVDGVFAKPKSAQGRLVTGVPTGSSVHLMVKHPTTYFRWAKDVGFQTLVVHVEGNEVLPTCRRRPKGMKMVAAIKSTTPMAALAPWVKHIDGIHLMMGPIGSYGGAFQERMVKRIVELQAIYPKFPLSCDVGMNPKTLRKVFAAGATRAVVGSYIFAAKQPAKQWQKLQDFLQNL